jgi:Bacterial protein of unknown function (DUF885)
VISELSDVLLERGLARNPLAALRAGRPVEALPPGGALAMEQDVSFAAGLLGRLDGIDGVDAAFLRDHLEQEAAEAERFWYRFPVTPYNAMPLAAFRTEILEAAKLTSAADADRYLRLLNDYAALVEQAGGTLRAQRQRGIRLPAWAVPAAMATMRGHAEAAGRLLVTSERCARLAPAAAGRLTDGAAALVDGRIAAAFARVLGDLAADERAGGPGVGLGQYPGGQDCYAGLISLHAGLDLTAERVHAIGLAEVERITGRIRGELGIADEPAYRAALAAGSGPAGPLRAAGHRALPRRAAGGGHRPEHARLVAGPGGGLPARHRLRGRARPPQRAAALRGRRPRPGAGVPPRPLVPARAARLPRRARVPRRRAGRRPAPAAGPRGVPGRRAVRRGVIQPPLLLAPSAPPESGEARQPRLSRGPAAR